MKNRVRQSGTLESVRGEDGAAMVTLYGHAAGNGGHGQGEPTVATGPLLLGTILRGGERIQAGGRTLDVAYTPGHAVHHVSYFEPSSGIAFIGDTGGLCIDQGYVLPATPPPDVDIEAWTDSVDRILQWHPHTLFITHFGPMEHPHVHLPTLLSNLRWMADLVKASLKQPGTDEVRSERLGALLRQEIQRVPPGAPTAPYEPTAPVEALWFGVARYWRKKADQKSSG